VVSLTFRLVPANYPLVKAIWELKK